MNRLCLIVLVLAGCADTGDEGMVVVANIAPEGTNCTISPEGSFFGRGTLSSDTSSPYLLTPLIESRIIAGVGQESLRTVALMGAKIDLLIGPITVEDVQNNITFSCAAEGATPCFSEAERAALAQSGVTKFRSLFSVPLEPNGGQVTAGFDLVPTQAVREITRKAGTIPAGGRLHAQVVATATVYGQLGGNEVSSLPFVYPVQVCNDCILNVVGACSATKVSFVPRKGNSCNIFQDGIVDCCTEGSGLVCPAVGTLP